VECKIAQLLAVYLAPGKSELDAEQSAALEGHLRSCPECARRIRFEQSFDQRVARVMRAVPVPGLLKANILERLQTARPKAWHRRPLWRVAAAAAAVLMAVGLGFALWGNSRVQLDPQKIVAENDAKGPKPDAQRWLAEQGIAFLPQTPLNLDLLTFYGLTEFQKKTVPTLQLYNGQRNVIARVYVVREPDFDLKNLPDTNSSLSGPWRVEILRDQNLPARLAYVVVYTGDNLEPFKAPAPSNA
jgi:hypothetical protein